MNTINIDNGQPVSSVDDQSAMQILRLALHLLEVDCAGSTLAARAGGDLQTTVAHAANKVSCLDSERPDVVFALVLGEFKAGKSSLINALVGRRVAAVDVFEMTQAVCRIIPNVNTTERVVLKTKNGQEQIEIGLEEFLRRSQERSLGSFTQADVYISTPLDLTLIDTPGLGATLSNEVNALDALATTDVVLYTVDAENIGGARDMALLKRIQEIGLPLCCVLTKVDVLDDEQTGEAVEYLSAELGIDTAHIFPVSASRSLLGHPEPGLARLKHHLAADIAPRGKTLREEARSAQIKDAAAELLRCIESVEDVLRARRTVA